MPFPVLFPHDLCSFLDMLQHVHLYSFLGMISRRWLPSVVNSRYPPRDPRSSGLGLSTLSVQSAVSVKREQSCRRSFGGHCQTSKLACLVAKGTDGSSPAGISCSWRWCSHPLRTGGQGRWTSLGLCGASYAQFHGAVKGGMYTCKDVV